jgi:DNA phosphorothioation-associated putative methyltransferase
MSSFKGKVVGGAVYIHKSALHLIALEQRALITETKNLREFCHFWNVVKFDKKDKHKFSLLDYQSFDDNEFPSLNSSYQINLKTRSYSSRNHSKTNPPILHRKELLIPPEDLRLEKFTKLTNMLEKLGAFKNINRLGTKLKWEEELKRLNIVVQNHQAKLLRNS